MADFELRQPTSAEIGDLLAVALRSYGADGSDDEVAHEALSNEIDRSWGAFADGRCVAGSGAFSFEVTIPGGATLPAAGITMIGVTPTYRRRGILTRLLAQLHADATARHEPIALLTASESSIYRRFGYGMAADVAHLRIASSSVVFDPPPRDTGSLEIVDPHVDTSSIEDIHDAVQRERPGWLTLRPGMWAQIRQDPSFGRDGRTPLRAVLHRDPSGVPDGYATWRIETRRQPDRLAGNTLHIEHLTAPDPEVEAALWSYLASIDLVSMLSWETAPVDPTIRWRLVEPRQLRTLAVSDMVWARLLDVPAVLSTRTYRATGTLDIDVTDRFHPDLGGRFVLTVDEAGAPGRCVRRAEGSSPPGADIATLRVDTADLATIVIGAVAPSTLARAGRLEGSTAALGLADAMFWQPERPWWPIEF